jgi:uncharacterized protein YacL
MACAFLVAVIVVLFEYSTQVISSKNLLLAAAGLLFGLITAHFFSPLLDPFLSEGLRERRFSETLCAAVFGYFGIIMAVKHAERFNLRALKSILTNPQGPAYIVDTSVIIDGRIADVLRLHLFQGPIIVPQFVLGELQSIADSEDSQRRLRGRRGLEILEALRQERPDMRIWGHDYPDIAEVDQKLLRMAQEMQGILVTNDYNLEKVAAVQNVGVINLNEVALAMRPSVYVGSPLRLDIIREGKESNQGVGYLDDGTMVVVDEGRSFIGENIEVIVSSILQTTAGRMIFAKPKRNSAHVAQAS